MVLAVEALGTDAYVSNVRKWTNEHGLKTYSFGQVYITLDRLEDKGVMTSVHIPATKGGGRPKRVFSLTRTGSQLLEKAAAHYRYLARARTERIEEHEPNPEAVCPLPA